MLVSGFHWVSESFKAGITSEAPELFIWLLLLLFFLFIFFASSIKVRRIAEFWCFLVQGDHGPLLWIQHNPKSAFLEVEVQCQQIGVSGNPVDLCGIFIILTLLDS